MLTAAAQNGSDFCKRRKLPSFELEILLYRVNWKKITGPANTWTFPRHYIKSLPKLKMGPKKLSKNKMSTLTDSGDRQSEWSVFEDLYVTVCAFYALIKVSVTVLDIGVFTACNNFIYLCPKRKLKGSKNTGSGTIFQILETKYSPKRRMQIANRILATPNLDPSLNGAEWT